MYLIRVVGKGDGLKKALDSIVKVIVNPNWKIKSNEQEIAGVEEPGLHMVLKKLFKLDQNSETCDFSFGSCLIDALSEETLEKWLGLNRGCFLLVAAYENSSTSVQENIKSRLKTHKKLLKKQDYAGSKILLKKMKE
jgi:predicted mannosyl-3-phosphoglycerate phosphatase (HAD superfamily)